MRGSQDNQRPSATQQVLLSCCAFSSLLFYIFWLQSDQADLRGWLWGALDKEIEVNSGQFMRVVLELGLLGLSIGCFCSAALRFLSVRRCRGDWAEGRQELSVIRCADVEYSTRIDLVARTIATFGVEHPFSHLTVIGNSDGRCGLIWNDAPPFNAPDGWTVESPTTWFLNEAMTFEIGDFPFPTLVSLGLTQDGREYFVDVLSTGGVAFVGRGASMARNVLQERWAISPWNRSKALHVSPSIDVYLVDEVSNDFAGLTIDVEVDQDSIVWMPRGRCWKVQHRLSHEHLSVDDQLCANEWNGDGTHVALAFNSDERAESTSDEPVHDQLGDYSFVVRVLGEVVVESVGGNEVVFERGRSQELLAWLVTHDERPTRSSAKSAIWDVAVRPTTFANVVSDIRRTLARACESERHSDWIERETGDDLVIDDRVISDAALLRHALQRSQGLPPTEVISWLRWPVSLLRGLPFQCAVYRWPDPEGLTSELVMLSMSASATLAQAYLEVADLQGVMWATGQGLRVLPGDEELIALRMRARARQGDVAALRQEWDSYERVLADEWAGGTPSPMLRNLRRELLEDRSR
jgi:hypothetical protein